MLLKRPSRSAVPTPVPERVPGERLCLSVRPRPRRRGAVAVEFALIASFLVLLILGMIEMSRGFMAKEALSNAARSGVRLACSAAGSEPAVTAEIKNILKENHLDAESARITIQVNDETRDVSTARRYDKVAVTVSLQVNKISWASAIFLSDQTWLSETVVMMRQK